MIIPLRSKSPQRDRHIPIPELIAFRLFELQWVYQTQDNPYFTNRVTTGLPKSSLTLAKLKNPSKFRDNLTFPKAL
jgi:hypothetical protein